MRKKTPDEKHDKVLTVLFTGADHERFRKQADRDGIPAGVLARVLLRKWMDGVESSQATTTTVSIAGWSEK